jgi:hypothetical protein
VILDVVVLENAVSLLSKFMVAGIDQTPETLCVLKLDNRLGMPGSSVGIATGYGRDGPGIESGGEQIFRTCPDRHWGQSSLLYSGYRVFRGGRKRPGRVADSHPF